MTKKELNSIRTIIQGMEITSLKDIVKDINIIKDIMVEKELNRVKQEIKEVERKCKSWINQNVDIVVNELLNSSCEKEKLENTEEIKELRRILFSLNYEMRSLLRAQGKSYESE